MTIQDIFGRCECSLITFRIKDNIKTDFRKKKKVINFILEKFYTKDKIKIESKDELEINLQTKSLFFNKLYYNFNQEIFFESTLYGKCNF